MKKILYIFIFFFLVLFSCEKAPLESGDITTIEYTIEPFTKIWIEDVMTVNVHMDTIHKIAITGDENIVDFIETEIRDGILYIYDKQRMKWLRDYKQLYVDVYVDTIREINLKTACFLTSTGAITSDDLIIWGSSELCECDVTLDCNKFHLKTSYTTVGNFRFSGYVKYNFIWTYFASNVYAENLLTFYNKVYTYGIGDTYINCDGIMIIKQISGGDVYYRGQPDTIIIEEQGKGSELFQMDGE